jgi:transcriptional regulator with XRE-family HTH domain
MFDIDNILSFIEDSPEKILSGIAARVKQQRLTIKLTQAELSKRAGLPLATYRRFERTGEISLRSLIMLAIVLSETENFSKLFSSEKYSSIDDLLEKNNTRKRGVSSKSAKKPRNG